MFREMRRKDKAMSTHAIHAALETADFGTLAINGEQGYPYSVALNYAFDGKSIYVHSAVAGEKVDLLSKDNRVCFNVVSDYRVLREAFDTDYHNVVVFGRAFLLEGDEKLAGLELLIKKYSGAYYDKGMAYIHKASAATKVYRIEIDHLTGKYQSSPEAGGMAKL